MELRVRFKFGEGRGRQCPRCNSADTWRWKRDTSVLRPLAAAFGRCLMTCRGCGHKFYISRKLSESPLVRMLRKLTGQPAPSRETVEINSGGRRPVRTARPGREMPALKVTFAEWERRQAEQQPQAKAASQSR